MCIFWNFITFARCALADSWRGVDIGADRFLFFTFQPESAITSNEVKSPVASPLKQQRSITAKRKQKQKPRQKTKPGAGVGWKNIQINFRTLYPNSPLPSAVVCSSFDQVVVAIFCVSCRPPFLILTYGMDSIFGFVISVISMQSGGVFLLKADSVFTFVRLSCRPVSSVLSRAVALVFSFNYTRACPRRSRLDGLIF